MAGGMMGDTAEHFGYLDGRARCASCGRRVDTGPDLWGHFVDYVASALDLFGPHLADWPSRLLADARADLVLVGNPSELVFQREACECGCTPALRVDFVQLLAGVRHDA